jgi:hypothetical protein
MKFLTEKRRGIGPMAVCEHMFAMYVILYFEKTNEIVIPAV